MTPGAASPSGTAELLAQALGAARIVGHRLDKWCQAMQPVTPARAATMAALDDSRQVYVDAFFKAFENLQDILENRCFRGLLLLEGEPVAEMSRRDRVNRLVQLRALPDEGDWVALKGLRNALSHDYPLALERQAQVLNEAVRLAPALRRAEGALTDYAERRLGVTPAAGPNGSSA